MSEIGLDMSYRAENVSIRIEIATPDVGNHPKPFKIASHSFESRFRHDILIPILSKVSKILRPALN